MNCRIGKTAGYRALALKTKNATKVRALLIECNPSDKPDGKGYRQNRYWLLFGARRNGAGGFPLQGLGVGVGWGLL